MGFKFDPSSSALIGGEVTAISEQTLLGIQTVISRGFTESIPVRNLAKMLESSVGMTNRQVQGMMNFNAGMVKAGTSQVVINRELVKYSARKVRERSRMIARTETMKVLNRGQRSALQQAKAQGHLPASSLRIWILADDDKLCPICEPLEDETVPLDSDFELGDPPLHPNCRCTFGFTQKPKAQRRMVASSGANRKVALKTSAQQVSNQIGGKSITEFKDLDELSTTLAKELKADVSRYEFHSLNAELKQFKAAASFEPSSRTIFMDARQSKAIQAAIDSGKLSAKEIRGLQNLVHETHHAASTVARTILEDTHFMSLTMEEGLVESKAQAFMRKTFGKAVTHPNYQPMVNAMEFLETQSTGFIDDAFAAATTESRVAAMESAVDKWLTSLNPETVFRTAKGNPRSAASLLKNLTPNLKFELAKNGGAISAQSGNPEGLYNIIQKVLK